VLIALFLSALSSATVLPGSSEVLLLALLNQHPEQWLNMLLVASIGNSLGGLITFAMGWGLFDFAHRRFASLPDLAQQAKAIPWVNKFGVWVLLLTWLPVVGDVLCFVAGAAKLPVVQSSLLMFLGKLGRYSMLVVFAKALAGVN